MYMLINNIRKMITSSFVIMIHYHEIYFINWLMK